MKPSEIVTTSQITAQLIEFQMLRPMCFKSNKKVSCPKRGVCSPSSPPQFHMSSDLFPAALHVSGISLCCHAGTKVSLATPITKARWLRNGPKPAMRSSSGLLELDSTGSDGSCEVVVGGCSEYGDSGKVT